MDVTAVANLVNIYRVLNRNVFLFPTTDEKVNNLEPLSKYLFIIVFNNPHEFWNIRKGYTIHKDIEKYMKLQLVMYFIMSSCTTTCTRIYTIVPKS